MTIPFVDLTWQHRSLQETFIDRITQVMERGDFILGQAVRDFEAHFAEKSGVQYGIGVASGTAAIALGLQACGLEQGDEILVPTNTFIATILGILQAGFKPLLVDCDGETGLMDLEKAAQTITPNTRAILPVHLYGQMVNPQALQSLAQANNLLIFEDAAQAHLAQHQGKIAGSLGKAAAFSFYPSKNLGAMGNGGMVLTDDADLAKRVGRLRNYGAESKYYHTEMGTNSRLDSMQATILDLKLEYLAQWNQLRYQAAQYYDQLLAFVPGVKPLTNLSGVGHVYHLYVIVLEEYGPEERQRIQTQLAEKGIETGIHYPLPCHLQPSCRFLGYQLGDFPYSENLCQQILSLPLFPGITQEQIETVVMALTTAIKSA